MDNPRNGSGEVEIRLCDALRLTVRRQARRLRPARTIASASQLALQKPAGDRPRSYYIRSDYISRFLRYPYILEEESMKENYRCPAHASAGRWLQPSCSTKRDDIAKIELRHKVNPLTALIAVWRRRNTKSFVCVTIN